MRKPAPKSTLSVEQLKKFAIATLIITGLVAMFANGEAAQVQAEAQAREAKNQLLTTEAEKLGTRRVAMGMTVKASAAGWGGDGGDSSGGSGEGSIDPDSPRTTPAFTQGAGAAKDHPQLPPNMPMKPGATVTVKGQVASDLQGPIGDAARAKNKGKAGNMFRPNAEQIEAIKAASRERTGGASQEDF